MLRSQAKLEREAERHGLGQEGWGLGGLGGWFG